MAKIICGVDVSSFSLEARIGPQGQGRAFSNTAEGIAELTAFCQQQGVEVIRIALAHKLLVRLNSKAREVRSELAGAISHSVAFS